MSPERTPATPARPALEAFVAECAAAAGAAHAAVWGSITLEVEHLDPLAVLESIYAPGELHFYLEHPAGDFALAAADAVAAATFTGPGRFTAARAWSDGWFGRLRRAGAAAAGPWALGAFAFEDELPAGQPFAPATVFLPRWQVARAAGRTWATANFVVEPGADPAPLVERVWRAHTEFSGFDYRQAPAPAPSAAQAVPDAAARPAYEAAVAGALAAIGTGRVEKVVVAREAALAAPAPLAPLACLNRLRARFPACHAFSVGNGAGVSFVGATPERLATVGAGVLQTEALAGSAPRGATAAEDARLARALLHSDKDLREHRLVLDSIARRLGALGLRLEFPPRPQLLALANVQHLRTPVRAPAPGLHLLEAVGALHPTPATGGVPRDPARALLAALEGRPRGLYAGALAWWDAAGDGQCVVGLRSGLVEGPRARLFAGAGIVEGSDPAREWSETETKLAALRAAFTA